MVKTKISKVRVYIHGVEWHYIHDINWWAAVRYHKDENGLPTGKITHTTWYDSAIELLWSLVSKL